MSRPLRYPDHLQARMPADLLAQIDAVLRPGESRRDAVQTALERLIEARVEAVPDYARKPKKPTAAPK